MKKRYCLLLISLCFFSLLWGQNNPEQVNRIKIGVFYFYPKNSSESFNIIRNDSIQMEINLNTQDTTIWRIRWQNDHLFNVRYWTGTKKLSDAELAFDNAHIIMIRITESEHKPALIKFLTDGYGDAYATDRSIVNLFNGVLTMQEAQFDTRTIKHPERDELELYKKEKLKPIN